MRRLILVAPDLTGDPLDELKQWLGISRSNEDANLIGLLQASLDICEGFLGQRPLASECEEVVGCDSDWITLSTLPVISMVDAETIDHDGQRSPIAEQDLEFAISGDGSAQVRVSGASKRERLAIRFHAGISSDWSALPSALRHGIIRLAAFHYRERDTAKTMPPPASVTALWRPWRRMRLT